MKYYFYFFLLLILSSCGTTGHLQFYNFNVSKYTVDKELMNIISKNSIYALPPKWITADSGDYFETRYVYFSNNPEEIYRIRFVGDSNDWNNSSVCTLGIIGEFDGNTWRNESALSNKEVERITKRFEEEILSKIKYSYVKSDNSTITDY